MRVDTRGQLTSIPDWTIWVIAASLSLAVGFLSANVSSGGGLLIAGVAVASLGVVIGRNVFASGALSSVDICTRVGIVLLVLSLFRIQTRDITADDVGSQGFYEFGLQGLAALFIVVGLVRSRFRLPITPALLLWVILGIIGIISAAWAPQPMLAILKGGQLIFIVVVVTLAASQFTDRYQAIRYLSWITLFCIAGLVVVQLATEGPGSLWGTFEFERQRLTLLAIHPLVLGGFTGAVAILLLVHSPKGIDWLALGFLASIPVLTNARGPFVIMCVVAAVYLFTVDSGFGGRRFAVTVMRIAAMASVVATILIAVNSSTFNPIALIEGIDSQDLRTLNGRIPLWETIFAYGQAQSDAELSTLFGHGFASFRHFGLEQFAFAGDAHNAPVQVLFELGALGLMVWILAVGVCGRRVAASATGHRAKLTSLLPLAYILVIQMMEASLADSRSFLLIILLVYAHAGLVSLDPDGERLREHFAEISDHREPLRTKSPPARSFSGRYSG